MYRKNKAYTETEIQETPFEEQGYIARIVSIVDLGKQPQTDYTTGEDKDPKYEMQVTFEFPDVRNKDDKPCWLSKRYQFPLAWPEKTGFKNNTNLYKLFNLVGPKFLTQSKNWPAYYFVDWNILDAMLGVPVYIEVVLNKNNKPRIVSVNKLPGFVDKSSIPELETDPYIFVVEDAVETQLNAWKNMFDWQRKMIRSALDEATIEVAKRLEELVEDKAEDKPEDFKKPQKTKTKPKKEEPVEDFDDDIPF